MHLDWVHRDFKYRKDKVTRYESISAGKGMPGFYLYEEEPWHRSHLSPLYVPGLERLTQQLIPVQRNTDARTLAFFTPDSKNLDVSVSSSQKDLSLACGERVRVPVTIANNSTHALSSAEPFQVFVSYHWWCRESGVSACHDGLRTALPRPLCPGEAVELPVEVSAPDEPGEYQLEVALVKEHDYWFEEKNPGIRWRLPARVTASPTRHAARSDS